MQNLAHPNIIVLTHGWTGSSVFSALFGEAGYWLGSETVLKPDYNTFENADLVGLNRRLFEALMPNFDHGQRFDYEEVMQIESRAAALDLSPWREFAARCNEHSPWLWKDPRLTWSIRVWAQLLDLRNTAFLVLTRDHTQAWISTNIRRYIQSHRFTREYNQATTQSNLRFLQDRGLPYVEASFEDLLLAPEKTLEKLNGLVGTALTMEHLRKVCQEPLGRKSRDWKDFIVASLIYAKNYGERNGRGRGAPPHKIA